MPALQMGQTVMDTDRMIPPSRSSMSQNGSSPGSAQSGQNGQNGPTYLNTTGTPIGQPGGMPGSSGGVGGSGQLVVNSVARKKKTERLVPPIMINHSALLNGHHNGFNNTTGNTNSSLNSTGVYGGGGLTNHGYTRDSVG